MERTQIFITATSGPKVLDGELVAVEVDCFRVKILAGELPVGASAVLYFPDSGRQRALTEVIESQDSEIVCRERTRIDPDKRTFPRLYAGLKVRYQGGQPSDEGRWLAGQWSPAGEWQHTDELMNFSVTGLAFDGTSGVGEGQVVLLEMAVGDDDAVYRAVGSVVRCRELDPEEHHENDLQMMLTHHLAVAFSTMPDEGLRALEELTLRLLDV